MEKTGRNELEYGVFQTKETYLKFHENFWNVAVSKRKGREIFTCSCPLDGYIRDSASDTAKVERLGLNRLPNQIVGEIPGGYQQLYVINEHGGIVPVDRIKATVIILRKGLTTEDLGMHPSLEGEEDV